MIEKLSKDQAGRIGGKKKWAKISKKKRSEMMRAVARARWSAPKPLQEKVVRQ